MDDEINKLFDFMPPTRDSIKVPSIVGWIMLIGRRKRSSKEETVMKLGYREFEITNDDIKALMDLRIEEMQKLKKELEEL